MIKHTILALVISCILCSCSSCASHKAFPTQNSNETQWEQQYRDGTLSWSEYQAKLKSEKKN